MNTFKMRILGLLLAVVGTPSLAWSVDASGFVITDACGSPPFGAGVADMHLHLTRFPKQKQGEELVLNMPSRLGPSGITDWMEIAAQSCSKKSGCTDAHSARVQVLDSSDAQMT